MKFTIYRGSWRRGGHKNNHQGYTLLLNDQNMMCCLGQIEYQRGVSLPLLRGKGMPNDLYCYSALPTIDDFLVTGTGRSNSIAIEAMLINDDSGYEFEFYREVKLKTLFATLGHEIEFVDGVAPWFNNEQSQTE